MEQEILNKVNENSQMLKEIYISVEKTRKYFQWTIIITIVTFVLPLLGLIFAIPFFLQTLTSSMQIL